MTYPPVVLAQGIRRCFIFSFSFTEWIYSPKRPLHRSQSNIIIALHIGLTNPPHSSSEFQIVFKIGLRNTECYWKKKGTRPHVLSYWLNDAKQRVAYLIRSCTLQMNLKNCAAEASLKVFTRRECCNSNSMKNYVLYSDCQANI